MMKRILLSTLLLIGVLLSWAAPTAPLFSDGNTEHWYYIVFSAGEAVLEDQGAGNSAMTKNAKYQRDAQIWKFVGNADNFIVQSKLGNYLCFNDYIKSTADHSKAGSFKLYPSDNKNYPNSWEIEYPAKGDQWNRWNQWGNTGPDVKIGCYTKDENNNALYFMPEAEMPNIAAYSKISEFKVDPAPDFIPESRHTIWYTAPATASTVTNPWMEYALPIGTGDFGAMIFGGIAQDRIQFNHKGLWTGSNTIRGCYQNFGDLYIEDISGVFGNTADKAVKDYVRYLDMDLATAGVSYKSPDGKVNYTREYIASNPDRCVAIRLGADAAGKISVRLRLFNGIKKGLLAATYTPDGCASFSGILDLVSFKAAIRVVPTGGSVSATDEYIEVKDADDLVVILSGLTNFDPHSPSYVSNANAMKVDVDNILVSASGKSWTDILGNHRADFKKYFGRVDFAIDAAANDRDTESIVKNYNARRPNPTEGCNLMLEELYYAYGRYLLISSARGIDSPANLQGIWNDSSSPAWQSDIHSNINVQMNYWPAETTNLSEMHLSFLNYLHSMVTEHQEWGEYARRSGMSKGWTCFTQNNIFGHSDYAENYVIANAWYSTHLWQHYAYTLDREFLINTALPVMIPCVDFWIERLKKASDGTLVCPQEWSPEHGPSAEDGTAHAQQIVCELFNNTLEALEVAGTDYPTEAGYAEALKAKLAALDRGLATETYNGPTLNGVTAGDPLLREWKYSSYTAGETGHRHQSHLMAMYPFGEITPESEWFVPAVNSLRHRGDQSTGWSLAWRIALWARALDGEHAHTIIRNALRHSSSYGQSSGAGGVYYNLLDSHAPFQIDGNFGYTAGVTEMLLQSHGGKIRLLPALPSHWAAGHISGLKAAGNFEISQKWKNRSLTEAVVKSNAGGDCVIAYPHIAKASFADADGNAATPVAINENEIKLLTEKGASYIITLPEELAVKGVETDGMSIELSDGVAFVKNPMVTLEAYDLAGHLVGVGKDSHLDLAGLPSGVIVIRTSDPAYRPIKHNLHK